MLSCRPKCFFQRLLLLLRRLRQRQRHRRGGGWRPDAFHTSPNTLDLIWYEADEVTFEAVRVANKGPFPHFPFREREWESNFFSIFSGNKVFDMNMRCKERQGRSCPEVALHYYYAHNYYNGEDDLSFFLLRLTDLKLCLLLFLSFLSFPTFTLTRERERVRACVWGPTPASRINGLKSSSSEEEYKKTTDDDESNLKQDFTGSRAAADREWEREIAVNLNQCDQMWETF
jgi:hypothetical protein